MHQILLKSKTTEMPQILEPTIKTITASDFQAQLELTIQELQSPLVADNVLRIQLGSPDQELITPHCLLPVTVRVSDEPPPISASTAPQGCPGSSTMGATIIWL